MRSAAVFRYFARFFCKIIDFLLTFTEICDKIEPYPCVYTYYYFERYEIIMKARLPKGIGGGPQSMQAMIKQAQKMQADMEKLQGELDEVEHEVTAGGGAVKVKIRGNRELVALELSPDVVDPEDVETLEDLVIAAVNEAIKTVDNHNAEEMNKVTGGLNVPGLI